MGLRRVCCCFPREETEPDRVIKGPKRRPKKPTVEFHLLLLGADGSGKSTLIRQMQIIHGQGFNDNERADLIPDIHKNIIDAMTVLVEQMGTENLNIRLEDESKYEDQDMFADVTNPMDERLLSVSRLWSDQGIQECFRRRSEYSTTHPLNVSSKYFLDAIEGRIIESGYLPITEDVIRVRKNTVGVIQYDFVVTDIQFKIIDVGGEREERVRWIDFLASRITCVIFLGAVDEYDTEFVVGDERKNRLKESMELFRQIQTHQWLNHTTFILFLNKEDVFKEKILTSDISDHFEDFRGFRNDPETGLQFIKRKFLEPTQPARAARMIYTHVTCATDTEGMRFVFDVVRDTILQLNLRQYNLV